MSPTARTLKLLREHGWMPWVVEQTVPKTFIKRDMFGFIDVMAIRGSETLAVQTTSGSNVSARVKKIEASDALTAVQAAGWRVVVHGWRKNAKNRWVVREVEIVNGNQR